MQGEGHNGDRSGTGIRLKGIAISPGIAVARVCLFNDSRHNVITPSLVDDGDVEHQVGRLMDAIRTAAARLEELRGKVEREIGAAEAEIFAAQKMMVQDPGIQKKMVDSIRRDKMGPEMAAMRVLDAYEARISALDNAYLRERATDIGEIKRRILDVLSETRPGLQCEGSGHCSRGRERVVVSAELTPSLTIDLDTAHVRGFVTEHGGVTSHAAILARALGIPAVSGIPGVAGMIACGTEVLVDGDAGEVVIWPEPARVERVRCREAAARRETVMAPVPGLRVMANISIASEAADAESMAAEGIGLYRTEFEFMAAGRVLSEEEQFGRYVSVVKAMNGKPVYIRLLDVGADKQVPGVVIAQEANPALGFRGARLLLQRPDLLTAQARAIARASVFGPVQVTYPMIADVEQFLALKRVFEDAVGRVRSGELRHGVMFEVPAACVEARALLAVADFGSIGTNDLFQYLMALDRNNEMVSRDFRPDHPAFWTMLRQVVAAAGAVEKPLSMCGELAGWPQYAGRILQAGIRSVSVSTRLIPAVRKAAQAAVTDHKGDAARE